MNSIRPAAFVSGASSGIGLALARMLADEGHDLTVVARGQRRLTAAADELRARGVQVHERPADLTDEDQLVAAFAAHAERFARLDVLVNNAGIARPGALGGIDAASVDAGLGLNVRAVVLAYREAAPLHVVGVDEQRAGQYAGDLAVQGAQPGRGEVVQRHDGQHGVVVLVRQGVDPAGLAQVGADDLGAVLQGALGDGQQGRVDVKQSDLGARPAL